MKRAYHLIKTLNIIWFLLFFTCSKPDAIKVQSAQDLSGKWRWISTSQLPLEPLTPQNTGIEEILVFNIEHTWYKTENDIKSDSGTYSIGHGSWLAGGAFLFTYDSIAYYRNGFLVDSCGSCDYYEIRGDTLHFTPYIGGRFLSYMCPYNHGKFWIKLPN